MVVSKMCFLLATASQCGRRNEHKNGCSIKRRNSKKHDFVDNFKQRVHLKCNVSSVAFRQCKEQVARTNVCLNSAIDFMDPGMATAAHVFRDALRRKWKDFVNFLGSHTIR